MKYYKLFFFVLVSFLLTIPLFHMNTAEITEQENRTLVKFPEITKKDKPNYEFGKEFESWLGDRFWGRDKLIDARFQITYKINGRIENDKAFIGDDGWMFEKHGIVDVPSLEKQYEEVKKSADILKRFDDKFKGKNIPIYLVLIPDRNELYQKYWEKYYIPKPKIDQNEELIKQLADHPNIHIIYPKKEFMDAIDIKKENVFRKFDFHMNNYGAEIFVKYVIKNLKILNQNILGSMVLNTKSSAKNWSPHIANILNVNVPSEYTQAVSVKKSGINIITNLNNKYIVTQTDSPVLYKQVYILGDCYNFDTLFPVLKYLFFKVSMIRTNQINDIYKEQIIRTQNIIKSIKENEIIIIIGANLTYDFLEKIL